MQVKFAFFFKLHLTMPANFIRKEEKLQMLKKKIRKKEENSSKNFNDKNN